MSNQSQDLALKYRPTSFKGVIGQDKVIASLKNVLASDTKRSFLFVGGAGTGKTTLARIVASKVNVDARNITEINGADNNGVDDMRELMDGARHVPLGGGRKLVIIDECQRLSPAAWDSMLKMVEEPPAHLYWCFATTEPTKIPATIQTRCVKFDLQPVPKDLIFGLLQSVRAAEGFSTPDDVLTVIAEKSFGSPRQSLAFFAQTFHCTSRRDAAELLKAAAEEGSEYELCKLLGSGVSSWAQVPAVLEPIKDQNAEGIRLIVVNWFTKVALGTKSDERAARVLTILEAFSTPYPTGATIAHVMLSLAKIIYQSPPQG